jgi:hypothetical protein
LPWEALFTSWAGRSTNAFARALASALVYLGGLWLGLMLGRNVNKWIVALQPTFQLLRKMARLCWLSLSAT